MKDDPLFLVISAVMLAVVGILVFGIGSFGVGGNFSRKYSNKMMQWRIIAQFLAVMLILFLVWARGGT